MSDGTSAPAVDPGDLMFASSSVAEHAVRGVLGLLLAVGSFVLAAAHPWALLGLVAAAVLWRGCPTCWALGLAQTVSRGRVGCENGSCGAPDAADQAHPRVWSASLRDAVVVARRVGR